MAKKRQFDENQVMNQISQYFWDHGYSATKMDELSALTGLTKTSLYNAFGNKEALFSKYVDFYI
jgi:TetR/AcrR family transcriptional repressor of nem operon